MKYPVTNNGKTNLHVGTAVIRPGETRMVDDHLVPPNLRPQATPASSLPVDPVVTLIAGKAAEVIAALPALSDDDIAQVLALESGSQKSRTTVLQAIDAEKLRRAALLPPAGGEGGGDGGGDGSDGGDGSKDGGDETPPAA
jgi:hypothetical protein